MTQEVRTARQVVEDYKKFNQNTVKKVAKRCPISKAVFYETVKVDENASQFIEKYKKEIKKKKQEKHLGRQLMSAPKKAPKPKVVAEKKPRVYVKTGMSDETLARMKQSYELHYNGTEIKDIAAKFNLSTVTIGKYITDYKKLNDIKDLPYTTRLVFDMIQQGMDNMAIAEKLNIHPKHVYYHIRKLKEVHPAKAFRHPKSPFYHVTDSIQRLLREGKSIDDICDIMNMKESTVKNNIYRFEKNSGTFVNKVKTETTEKVKALLHTGLNKNQIAKKLCVDWQTVNYHVEKLEKLKEE